MKGETEMKKVKKFVSLVLAAVMVMAMAVTVLAAEGTQEKLLFQHQQREKHIQYIRFLMYLTIQIKQHTPTQ